jgi:VanZ family protein
MGDAPVPVVIGLWGPVAAWMAAIYWGAGLSQMPGPVAGVSDTIMHMAGYSGLALLTLRATSGGKWSGVTWKSVLLALVIATIHGMSVEWEQMYVPTRMAEWRDVGNDLIGAAIALAPAWAWATMKAAKP